MTKLIIFIFIFYIISQIITSVKKKQAKIKRDIPNLQKDDSPIQIDLDFLEEKIAKIVDKKPRLIMETQEKPRILAFESNINNESFDEETYNDVNAKRIVPAELKETPKPQKSNFLAFAPKNIAQGIILSEILKRPKY